MSRIVVVTGTDTGVGKTIATAALAVQAQVAGRVTVVKPTQTGIGPDTPDERADVEVIDTLCGASVHEVVRLPEPLAPDTAARRAGVNLPTIAEHAARIRGLCAGAATVIVEGAGGLLVRLDLEGGTLLDLAEELRAEVYVVTRAGLGTLNHTELTVDALRARGIEPVGLIVGSWPARPGTAEICNLEDLPRLTGVPIAAVLPEGAGTREAPAFVAEAISWFTSPRAGSG